MHDLLNHYPIYFPKRNEQLYTLKQFLDTSANSKYHLPIIVNVTSLNNYGRCIKNLLTKNSQLLLIGVYQLDSILAEYHRSHDGRHHTHRHRFTMVQGKMATRASTKFRRMKKLSRSLASLTPVNQTATSNNDEDFVDNEDDDGDDKTYSQRNLMKNLNEKRSTSAPLCRIPVHYRRFFELLNENDQSVEPYHKLIDLIQPGYAEKRTDKWPHALFLRTSCTAYTQKNTSESFLSTCTNEQYSTSTASNDSCYSSASDLDAQKNSIILNDKIQPLQAGQILTILGDCIALLMRIGDKDFYEQQLLTPPSPSHSSPSSWFRDKSKIFFSKKRRQSQTPEIIPNEIIHTKSISKKCESYLKCQTQQGDIVYISLQESGLFSPLNYQASRSKSNTNLSGFDISEVYQLKDLLSNFRFPLSVRHLDGSISFDHAHLPGSINQHETATKLRLLMPYSEHVVFACPINLVPPKSSRTSSPYLILPLSINADIEIQPCINMYDISRTEDFHKLIDACFQMIEQYQKEISLIHFPLQFTNNNNRRKQMLYKKRSQSESFVDYVDEGLKYQFRHSDEQLNYSNDYQTEHSCSSVSSPLRYQDSIETITQKLSTDAEPTASRHSDHSIKKKADKQNRYSQIDYSTEDEIYRDVDKIYDYIRSGNVTDDVQKIQAREKKYHSSDTINLLPGTNRGSEQRASTTCASPAQMMTHRFVPKVDQSGSSDQNLDFHSCKNDRNVDDEQAHALYIASKQRSQDSTNSKTVVKMKRLTKN